MAVHSCEAVHQLVDEWERGSIANGKGVQSAVVLNGLEIAVFLLNKEEGECVRVTFWPKRQLARAISSLTTMRALDFPISIH